MPEESGSFGMLRAFVRSYPMASALTLLALLLAGLLDGLGLSTLLSMLSLATESTAEPSLPERIVLDVTGALGLEPGPGPLLALAIVILSLKAGMMLLAKRQVGYAVANVATDLRLALIRACMRSRWSYYLSQPVGRLSNAVATEADRAAYGFRYGALMSAEVINAFIYIVVAVLISWQATLAALVGAVALLAALQVLVRVAARAGRSQTQLLKSLLTVMTDQLGAVKPLKAMAREEHLDSLLGRQTEALRRALRRQVFSTEALAALQEPALAILVGAGFFVLVVHLEMPLAAAVVILFLLARAVTLLAKAQRAWQSMAISESAYWSLAGAIRDAEAQREPPQGHLDPELTEAIEFDRVSFSHGRGPILKEQTLRIPAGGLTVITGASGVGKTTVLDLVVGLLEPTGGTLRIDGVPFSEVDHHAWRRRIGYVPQDPLLVNDSVLRNLTLGEPGMTAVDAEAALRAADAWDFVQALPEGLETLVGERGGRLSGGQRQRLALARALIHRPRLLILDEFTSNLDPAAEAAVLTTIAALRGRLTLLAVTHGEALLDIADQVLHMGAGNVVSLATARARREAIERAQREAKLRG